MAGFGDNGNVGSNWGPGGGLSQMLLADRQMGTQGLATLSRTLAGALQGMMTAKDGGDSPWKGALMGAAGPEVLEQYKQTQDAGKAADYFMKAGGDQLYEQMGIHPEQWKTLGSRDKAAAVAGFMKQQGAQEMMARSQEWLAQSQERLAKSKLAGEEAEAWQQFMQNLMGGNGTAAAPGATSSSLGPTPDTTGPAPWDAGTPAAGAQGNVFSRENIVRAMAEMGKTSPRLASALSRTLIPKLMEQGTEGPQSFTSPSGNPYVWMGHTLMPDRPGMDMGAAAASAPEGYEAVQTGPGKVQFIKTSKVLPSTFHSSMDKLQEQLSMEQETLDKPAEQFAAVAGKARTPDEIKRLKANAQQTIDTLRKRGQATVDRYFSTGYLTPEQRDSMYQELGVKPAEVGKPEQGGKTEVNREAVIAEANQAISKGADPVAVRKRLKDKYGIEVK